MQDRYGLVWAYMGLPERIPVMPRFDAMEPLEDGEEYLAFDNSLGSHGDVNGPEVVPYSWLHMNDNVMDPFHVQVLQVELEVHQVENLGGFFQVAEKFLARQTRFAAAAVFFPELVQVLVGQLGNDDQLALDALDAVDGEEKGMADGLDVLDGSQLFFGVNAADLQAVEGAVDELDRFVDAAGGLALPDLAEAAASQGRQKSITAQGFRVRLFFQGHGSHLQP